MARGKLPPLTYRIFINERPKESYTAEELAEFGRIATQRLGDSFNRNFSLHPDQYVKVCRSYDEQHAPAAEAGA